MTTRLIIVAHAPLAAAFRAVAVHVLGEAIAAQAAWIDVAPDAPPSASTAQMTACLSQGSEFLILTDLPHATPHNCAMQASLETQAQGYAITVVSHCTVSALLRGLTKQHLPAADLAQLMGQSAIPLTMPNLRNPNQCH